jgi:hypothetical protein
LQLLEISHEIILHPDLEDGCWLNSPIRNPHSAFRIDLLPYPAFDLSWRRD